MIDAGQIAGLSDRTYIILALISACSPIVNAMIGAWINSRVKDVKNELRSGLSETNAKVVETGNKIDQANASIVEQQAGLKEQKESVAALVREAKYANGLKSGIAPAASSIGALSADTHEQILGLQQQIDELRQQDIAKGIARRAEDAFAKLAEKEGLKEK